MSQYKFRVWDNVNFLFINVYKLILGNGGQIMAVIDIQGESFGLHQCQIMLYSPFFDCNGKQICAGDIVHSFHNKWVVIFDGLCFLVKVIKPATKDYISTHYLSEFMDEETEIIGNTFENPELWEDT